MLRIGAPSSFSCDRGAENMKERAAEAREAAELVLTSLFESIVRRSRGARSSRGA